MISKQEQVKEILALRRRKMTKARQSEVREIEIFEAQVEKSLKRVDGPGYIAKKFDRVELEQIKAAYEKL